MTSLNPSSDPIVSSKYEILGTLGEGAMAIVYKARHKTLDSIVAIKVLKTTDPELMERFAQEMRVLARLRHRNIIEAIDCFENSLGQSFFVMEFVEGRSIATIISSNPGSTSEEDIARITLQALEALDHAHSQQIIHRDLKPANLMLSNTDGETVLKVLDFGIARLQDDLQRLTAAGQVVGSPLYMSPEQCMGKDIDPRSDLYSLGILLYELVTGRLPYVFSTASKTMAAHCNPDIHPEPLSVYRDDLRASEQLNQIIMRAVETDPDKRFQTAKEFKRAIDFWIQCVRAGADVSLPKELSKPDQNRIVEREQREELAVALRDIVKSTRPTQALPRSDRSSKPLKNFLIGLLVSLMWGCLVIMFLLNFRQCIELFKSASRSVNSVFSVKSQPVESSPEVDAAPVPQQNSKKMRPYSRLDSIDDTDGGKAVRIE